MLRGRPGLHLSTIPQHCSLHRVPIPRPRFFLSSSISSSSSSFILNLRRFGLGVGGVGGDGPRWDGGEGTYLNVSWQRGHGQPRFSLCFGHGALELGRWSGRRRGPAPIHLCVHAGVGLPRGLVCLTYQELKRVPHIVGRVVQPLHKPLGSSSAGSPGSDDDLRSQVSPSTLDVAHAGQIFDLEVFNHPASVRKLYAGR